MHKASPVSDTEVSVASASEFKKTQVLKRCLSDLGGATSDHLPRSCDVQVDGDGKPLRFATWNVMKMCHSMSNCKALPPVKPYSNNPFNEDETRKDYEERVALQREEILAMLDSGVDVFFLQEADSFFTKKPKGKDLSGRTIFVDTPGTIKFKQDLQSRGFNFIETQRPNIGESAQQHSLILYRSSRLDLHDGSSKGAFLTNGTKYRAHEVKFRDKANGRDVRAVNLHLDYNVDYTADILKYQQDCLEAGELCVMAGDTNHTVGDLSSLMIPKDLPTNVDAEGDSFDKLTITHKTGGVKAYDGFFMTAPKEKGATLTYNPGKYFRPKGNSVAVMQNGGGQAFRVDSGKLYKFDASKAPSSSPTPPSVSAQPPKVSVAARPSASTAPKVSAAPTPLEKKVINFVLDIDCCFVDNETGEYNQELIDNVIKSIKLFQANGHKCQIFFASGRTSTETMHHVFHNKNGDISQEDKAKYKRQLVRNVLEKMRGSLQTAGIADVEVKVSLPYDHVLNFSQIINPGEGYTVSGFAAAEASIEKLLNKEEIVSYAEVQQVLYGMTTTDDRVMSYLSGDIEGVAADFEKKGQFKFLGFDPKRDVVFYFDDKSENLENVGRVAADQMQLAGGSEKFPQYFHRFQIDTAGYKQNETARLKNEGEFKRFNMEMASVSSKSAVAPSLAPVPSARVPAPSSKPIPVSKPSARSKSAMVPSLAPAPSVRVPAPSSKSIPVPQPSARLKSAVFPSLAPTPSSLAARPSVEASIPSAPTKPGTSPRSPRTTSFYSTEVKNAIQVFLNNSTDASTDASQLEIVKKFEEKVNEQTNNPNPQTPYRGIGALSKIVEYGDAGAKKKGLQLLEIFSPENGRFTKDSKKECPGKGEIIYSIEVEGSIINLDDVFKAKYDDKEAIKEIVGYFHSNAQVKFTTDKGVYSCDNRNNKTAIFAPNSARQVSTSGPTFSTLSSILQSDRDRGDEILGEILGEEREGSERGGR